MLLLQRQSCWDQTREAEVTVRPTICAPKSEKISASCRRNWSALLERSASRFSCQRKPKATEVPNRIDDINRDVGWTAATVQLSELVALRRRHAIESGSLRVRLESVQLKLMKLFVTKIHFRTVYLRATRHSFHSLLVSATHERARDADDIKCDAIKITIGRQRSISGSQIRSHRMNQRKQFKCSLSRCHWRIETTVIYSICVLILINNNHINYNDRQHIKI